MIKCTYKQQRVADQDEVRRRKMVKTRSIVHRKYRVAAVSLAVLCIAVLVLMITSRPGNNDPSEADSVILADYKSIDIPEDEVTPLDRTKAKAVNFGVVYGMSGFGLGESLHISRSEGQKYINDYFAKHTAVRDYLNKQIEIGEADRQVSTYFGRIRKIPEFASRKFMERELAKRLAMNTPIQGTAADIIKIAMNSVTAELRKRGLESKLILQIHDELIVEGPDSEVEDVREILDNCMKGAADLAVDLVCDIHTGKTWYELK